MLTQAEADHLLQLRKWFVQEEALTLFPTPHNQVFELQSEELAEKLLFDAWRSSMRLSKVRYQTRARTVIPLARLDLGGAPHTNPDGERLDGPHIHKFREGYDLKWAYPLNPEEFPDPANPSQSFQDFCRFCHIDPVPPVQESLL